MSSSPKAFIIVLALSLLFLAGCGNFSGYKDPNPEYQQFYQGTQGVMMRFQPGSPPPRVYYYAFDTDMDNSFNIGVELVNDGASDALGALYISGFSPEIIAVEGMSNQPLLMDDCILSMGNLGGIGGKLGGMLSCPNLQGAYLDNENLRVRVSDIAGAMGLSSSVFEMVDFTMIDGQWNLDVVWDSVSDKQVFNHGRMLIMALSSLDLRRYNGYPFNKVGVLKGDNYFFPGGEDGFQDFTAHIYDWPAGLDEYLATFGVTSCYAYTTYAAPMVCIDPAPYTTGRKVCIPREYKWSGSQGAPVAITSLKQDPTPRSIMLTFTIRNVGAGDIVHPGYLERCSPYYNAGRGGLDRRYMDTVYIGDVRIGNQRLMCTPGPEIRLNDGIGTFTCEYFMEFAGSSTAYETPVVIELWYGYKEYMETKTLIKRAG